MHETKSKMNCYKKGGMSWHGMGWDEIREYPPLKSHWYWCLSRVFRYPIAAFPTTNVVGHLGYTFGGHGGCKWVDSGAHFSFLINNTFIFLIYVFLTAANPFLTCVNTNSFHGFLLRSHCSSDCGLSFPHPCLLALVSITGTQEHLPGWGSGFLWVLHFGQGSY